MPAATATSASDPARNRISRPARRLAVPRRPCAIGSVSLDS
jgi:hypothetical protein